MGLKLVAAPAVEPITLAEAKAHIRSVTNDEDTLVTRWIAGARRRAQTFTQRVFITQTWEWLLDGFDRWQLELPNGPLQSVTSVKYLDEAGVEQTLAPARYIVDAKSDPGRITPAYGDAWPTTLCRINAVTIQFVAGYGAAAADVPEEIKIAMLLMIAHLDQHRSEVAEDELFEIPQGAPAYLTPYRVTRF